MSVAVYRAYDAVGDLLYVGCSVALDARLRQHEQHSPWWLFHCYIEVRRYPSHAKALAEETRLIQTLHPRWNVRDRSPEHPDGPISYHGVTGTPHLALEVQTWREWKQAKTKAEALRIRRERKALGVDRAKDAS